uniref:Uncharacterized protein LOC114348133 n=1 Tax=Diabrotica virgifera virgifera TaxID=50390 RepID=A0A6P7GXU2_DIAVI
MYQQQYNHYQPQCPTTIPSMQASTYMLSNVNNMPLHPTHIQPMMYQQQYNHMMHPVQTYYMGLSNQIQNQPIQIAETLHPQHDSNSNAQNQWKSGELNSEYYSDSDIKGDVDIQSIISADSVVDRPNDFQEVRSKKRKILPNSPKETRKRPNHEIKTQNRFEKLTSITSKKNET